MNIRKTKLDGTLIIEPKYHRDLRGFFAETYHEQRYARAGINALFVQDNVSFSNRGVLRGLHYQKPNPQGKLVTVLQGEIFDVAVDIRVGSPTFGEWVGVPLSADNGWQFWVPTGFAHGFCVVSEKAMVIYKCTEFYYPQYEASILWNDSEIGVVWPTIKPEISQKDLNGIRLRDVPKNKLSHYSA